MWTRLRPRVLFAVLLTAMVPLAIATSQGYHCAREAVLALVDGHLHSVLQSQRNLVEQWRTQRESELRVLAGSVLVEQTLSNGCVPPAQDAAVRSSDRDLLASFTSVTLMLADGSEISVFAESDYVLEIAPDKADQPEFVPFQAEVQDEQGSTVALLKVEVDLVRELIPILRQSMDPTATIYLIPSHSGNMVSIGETGKSDLTVADVREALHQPVQHEDMYGHLVSGHRELRLLAATEIPGTEWVLGAELDPEAALRWLDILIWRAVWMSVITLILVVHISLWISGTLANPLKKMAEVADRIRGGDHDAEFSPSTLREIEEVQKAIRQMLQELRQKERQLIQSGALAVVGELTSMVVHEMRNPLSSIKLNLQVFQRQAETDPFTQELTQIALQQVDRLERMLTELLQYGKPIILQPIKTLFGDIVADCLRSVESLSRGRNINMVHEDETEGTSIEVDREQFRRVLTNLLENAIQASAPGSAVEIKGLIHRCTPSRLQVTVEDNGSGFNEETKRSLFKPFFTTKPGGVGLGLANVRKIVELHGGNITSALGPNGGAIFTVEVPLLQSRLNSLVADSRNPVAD